MESTELFQSVIDKLDKEAEKLNTPWARPVEELLRNVCRDNPSACERVLDKGKTLKGAYEAMYEVAKKRKGSANCVCIVPDEAKRIIFEYFGIFDEEPAGNETPKSQTSANVGESAVVDLFDLIG